MFALASMFINLLKRVEPHDETVSPLTTLLTEFFITVCRKNHPMPRHYLTTLLQGLQNIIPVGASETIIPKKEIIGWLVLLKQASHLMWQLHRVSFSSEKSAPVIKACLAAAQALYEPDKPYSITIPKSCGATLTTLLIQTTTVHEQMRAVLGSSSADTTTQASSDAVAQVARLAVQPPLARLL